MRIAYLVNQYPKVSHTFIRREILALEARGVRVDRYALRGWDAETPDAADAAERSRTQYVLAGGLGPLLAAAANMALRQPGRFAAALRLAVQMARGSDRPWPLHLVYLAEACWLLPRLRAAGVEHLHAHFGTNPAEVAMLLRALGGPPYSFTAHGPEEFDQAAALGLARKIEHARFVAAVSSYGRSQLWRWARPEDWPKVQVVHCGLDAVFLDAAVTPVPGARRLVCVGRLCAQKGQLLLIEAAAQAMAAMQQPFTLVLAGDGEMRPQVEAAVARFGIASHVRITGWLSSAAVAAELQQADALVLPSFAEGLPVVIMEAMALARPVLSTYVAGIPELVRHGQDGWLFPAGDVAAAAQAMQQCLQSSTEVLSAMGGSGRQRVRERHNIDSEVAKLIALMGGPQDPPAPA